MAKKKYEKIKNDPLSNVENFAKARENFLKEPAKRKEAKTCLDPALEEPAKNETPPVNVKPQVNADSFTIGSFSYPPLFNIWLQFIENGFRIFYAWMPPGFQILFPFAANSTSTLQKANSTLHELSKLMDDFESLMVALEMHKIKGTGIPENILPENILSDEQKRKLKIFEDFSTLKQKIKLSL